MSLLGQLLSAFSAAEEQLEPCQEEKPVKEDDFVRSERVLTAAERDAANLWELAHSDDTEL